MFWFFLTLCSLYFVRLHRDKLASSKPRPVPRALARHSTQNGALLLQSKGSNTQQTDSWGKCIQELLSASLSFSTPFVTCCESLSVGPCHVFFCWVPDDGFGAEWADALASYPGCLCSALVHVGGWPLSLRVSALPAQGSGTPLSALTLRFCQFMTTPQGALAWPSAPGHACLG